MRPIEVMDPLITSEQIASRVRALASEINQFYADASRPLSVIVVLKGACFFAIDLLRHLTLDTRLDFLQASSYSGMGSTGEVRLLSDITMPIGGTDVLLVEDIVDTGLTAAWLLQHLSSHRPASVRLCTLLDKPSRRRLDVTVDWSGFTIPDAFVLGYGLDFEETFRNLPAVYVARPTGETE
ncbi:MAG: hypoxanthine phosphoribosyltransferase [Chloroflexota bacterium]